MGMAITINSKEIDERDELLKMCHNHRHRAEPKVQEMRRDTLQGSHIWTPSICSRHGYATLMSMCCSEICKYYNRLLATWRYTRRWHTKSLSKLSSGLALVI